MGKRARLKNLPAFAGVNFADMKPATDDMVAAGYAMMKWRETLGNYTGISGLGQPEYGKDAISMVYKVRDSLAKRGKIYKSEASKVLTRLSDAKDFEIRLQHGKIKFPQYKVIKHRELVGEAHEMAMHIIVMAGHAPPTQKQLDAHGDGGGR